MMGEAEASTAKAPSALVSTGRRLLYGGIGMGMGFLIGAFIWGFDALSGQHHDYTVTGLTLMLILGGIGFFVPAKRGWRETFLYFLLLGFLDN